MLFETGHLLSVAGLVLDDGREVVVKARPPTTRIAACFAVQRHVHGRGFPCPEPLAGPAPLGALLATAEVHVARHDDPPSPPPAPASAALLASLVTVAPPATDHPDLEPAPPWVGWDHDGDALWVLTYNAKKELLGGGDGYVALLESELDERLRLAGC